MARRVNQEKLLAKIAAVTGANLEELKEVASKKLHSHDEAVMEVQSVINFYKARVQPRPPEKRQGESELAFAGRQAEFQNKWNEWRIRTCEGCNQEFAYAYTYEGVKFCSLDCLDDELRKIGLKVTYGRDLMRRWGRYHPAIVPSSAFRTLKSLHPDSPGFSSSMPSADAM